ncbi:uncharacterized protein [Physcomitrium patens]|uniref:Fucosyltransferase n=1 Tax=Physcomitrium patens TaxID=3218 RepID=A0A2K1JX85_PHYPA|nr:uncharacterized protein LOC112287852 [Physcomitrium patens]XP_024387155.1 uncharacterized protein LOC112287852 [Physcomitrium patens]XP_024387156.1 uncharacterized protein LOC112287852 [Physcomitrium patens]XP_024387157.1 uncharacterized protein LOC112287852 [Physcomitrium patens]XP_024387158.1 uncharacterized protein LOC112287852 [Physcomitrium patens]XP_024387159.1 uncharacterized protein LOC112287852 [Physcomitrium patens]XP_024387160.1 uncharacterized protein LOC112287852 [Physcomitriu|eukprot:XP_024387154.1 uncharacterized protein LOC112287852 [Physcomitrella patens]
MAISRSRKIMITKAIAFVVGGTFAIFLLQLYYLEEPLQILSFTLYPKVDLPMQVYAEEELMQPTYLDLEDARSRRLYFKGSNDTLWDPSFPTQECETRWFPERHWTRQAEEAPQVEVRANQTADQTTNQTTTQSANQTTNSTSNYKGTQLYGSVAAQHAIWRHQHPRTCHDKKFIVYEALGPEHGIGTILHAIGVALQAALNLDRILVLYPQPNFEWVNGWFCQNSTSLDSCYLEPLSNCTAQHAFGNRSVDLDNMWRYSELSLDTYYRNESDWRFTERVLGSSVRRVKKDFEESANIMQVLRGETPHMFHSLLNKGNISNDFYHWWRAQSIAYIVRPNSRFLHELGLRRNFYFNKQVIERGTISVHIPYGNRWKEDRTANNEAFLQAAESLVNQYPNDLQRKIFLSTEDPETVGFFSKLDNWKVQYTTVSRVATDGNVTHPNLALNNFASRYGWDEEFINSILNLQIALECDGFVGQLSSNWNRLIDELRSTVRCKYNQMYVDVVQGFNISNYFW